MALPDRRTMRLWGKRLVGWPLSGALVWLLVKLFSALSIDRASALGGGIARSIGPHLGFSERARRNLRRCFPEWEPERIDQTVRAMWDNLGRAAGEFPHLRHLDVSGNDPRVELVGSDILRQLRDDGEPGFLFSAHIANWEMLPFILSQQGLVSDFVYRGMNAPLADKVLRQSPGGFDPDHMIRKGPQGTRRIARTIRNGGHIGMLVDQKLSQGVLAPFFGRPARTTPTVAIFALRYRCPVVPVRIERLGGARFRVTLFPPMDLPDSGDTEADILTLTTRMNAVLEEWIRARPDQWFWLHRRWGRDE